MLRVSDHTFVPATEGGDDRLTALITQLHDLRARSDALEARCAELAQDDPVWDSIDALHRAQDRAVDAIVAQPAGGWAGVARKLALWRQDAAVIYPDQFHHAHEGFAFSAYADVLRLAGLQRLAHPNDPATWARLGRG